MTPFLPLTASLLLALACLAALVRSTWITLRQGGVRWRDHFYPLATLRAHVRRRTQERGQEPKNGVFGS